MTVNFEIKGMLARLLATEDLIIEHKKVETACFNVQTRVLTLPMWEKASNNIYTMLVLHEISHSLFTSTEDWTETHNIPGQFVNVCEDARVEKLCKRKYPGSPKSFFNGYKELFEQDFFQIGNDNLETYNLADRANLYFKIGNFINVPIQSGEESDIITQIADAETFDEVLIAAERLYNYCKSNQKQNIKVDLNSSNEQTGGVEEPDNQEKPEDSQLESMSNNSMSSNLTENNNNESEKDETENNSPTDSQGGNSYDEPEVKTSSSFNDSIKELINHSSFESTYLEIPNLDLEKVVVSNREIHDHCNQSWETQLERFCIDLFSEVDKQYRNFKDSAQKEVNYLVKEFECRKAADSYIRSAESKTGVLDTSVLHTYKFNDDIFKKITISSDGKNHGLIFILDWSGSMSTVFMDTIKQLYSLIWFCKKVSIPFDVYAFTNDWGFKCIPGTYTPLPYYEVKENLLNVDSSYSLMNIFTSNVSSRELEKQMINIYRISKIHRNEDGYFYYTPNRMGLSGTPLNETLIALHGVIPQFKSKNNLQKVHCVILTDGEAHPLSRHVLIKPCNNPSKSFFGKNYINYNNSFLRDRKTGNVYSLKNYEGYTDFTNLLIHNLRDNFSNVNFIGMRILKSAEASNFIRNQVKDTKECQNILQTWKKEKSFSIKTSGYNKYFGISSSSLSQDTEFDVAVCATKSQIKSAFVKSLRNKKMNKRILSEFIQLVA